MAKKTKTEYQMTCQQCGAKMAVYLIKDSRFMGQCYGCGSILFGPASLLERLKYTDTICPHHPDLKPCKGGVTSWCRLCRIRMFAYNKHGK